MPSSRIHEEPNLRPDGDDSMSSLVRYVRASGACNGYLLRRDLFTIRDRLRDRVCESDVSIKMSVDDVRIVKKRIIPTLHAKRGLTLPQVRAFKDNIHVAGIDPETGASARVPLMDFVGFAGWSGSPVVYNFGKPGDYMNCGRIGHVVGVSPGEGCVFHVLGLGMLTTDGREIGVYRSRPNTHE